MRIPSILAPVVALACLVVVAACGSRTATSPSPAPTSSLVAPLPGQTETEWGRIWDDIPPDFPVYPGAVRSDESASGAVSASLVVEGLDPSAVLTWTDSALSNAGFTVTGGQASMEDGSMSIDAVRSIDCRVLVTSAPLGSLTSITILYGASCPQP